MTEWKSQGLPVERVPQISVHDLSTMKDERPDLVVIDVRELSEWDEGHIDGALHVPMSEALARKDLVPDGRPKAVLCAGGLRSSTVISALSRAGLTNFHNVIGGMTAWQKGGYSTVKR
jgi:hydroxyacylglutathione hydrolase